MNMRKCSQHISIRIFPNTSRILKASELKVQSTACIKKQPAGILILQKYSLFKKIVDEVA